MSGTNQELEIKFLDHVAIRVTDLRVSAAWYEKVLGLKKYQLAKWGEYPIFMLAKKSGIALFPADKNYPRPPLFSLHLYQRSRRAYC